MSSPECMAKETEFRSEIKDLWHSVGERVKMNTFQWVVGFMVVATGYVIVAQTQQSIAMAEMRSDVEFMTEIFKSNDITFDEYTIAKKNTLNLLRNN